MMLGKEKIIGPNSLSVKELGFLWDGKKGVYLLSLLERIE